MKTISIGRSSTNTYPIEDSTVSKQHAVITVTEAGDVWIKDLNSTNGTYVDGKKVTDNTKLVLGNVVRLGNKTINWHEIAQSYPRQKAADTILPYSANKRLIGRGDDCQIRLGYPDISTHHATLEKCADGNVIITDSSSTNGTYVNGMRISGSRILNAGDQVSLANKYPIDWQSVFAPTASVTPKKTNTGLTIGIVAAVAVILIAVGGWFGYNKWKQSQPLEPATIYAQYKKSVVLIVDIYTYTVTYKGKPLTSYWESELTQTLSSLYLDQNGELQQGKAVASGTGSFMSSDGRIITNRHVVSYVGARDEVANTIKQQVVQLIYMFATNIGGREGRNWLAIAQDIEGVDVERQSLVLGVFMNDTHVNLNTLSGMIPCTTIKLSDDDKLDVAIIQTNDKKTPEGVKIVDVNDCALPENIEVGDAIYTIGFPLSFTLADTDEGIEANNQDGKITQTQGDYSYGHNITIQHGASGSPIFDSYGKFAGLIVSGVMINGNAAGYNNAVHPNKIKEFINK